MRIADAGLLWFGFRGDTEKVPNMIWLFKYAVGILAVIFANSGYASQVVGFQNGDEFEWAQFDSSGNQLRSWTMIYRSPAQLDRKGKSGSVTFDKNGNLIEGIGLQYKPHDGRFPESGNFLIGSKWTTNYTRTRTSSGSKVNSTKKCEVKAVEDIKLAGVIFSDSLHIYCEVFHEGSNPDGKYNSWFWRAPSGYLLWIASDSWEEKKGNYSIKLMSSTSNFIKNLP